MKDPADGWEVKFVLKIGPGYSWIIEGGNQNDSGSCFEGRGHKTYTGKLSTSQTVHGQEVNIEAKMDDNKTVFLYHGYINFIVNPPTFSGKISCKSGNVPGGPIEKVKIPMIKQ